MQMKTLRVVLAKFSFATCMAAFTVSMARADYQSTILADAPKAYYRFNDGIGRTLVHTNLGSLGAAGNAINDPLYFVSGGVPVTNATGVVNPFPGAIVGDGNRSEFFDYTTRAEIPWNAAFNTPNTRPFTIEAWFYPASDQTGTGQAPINNRYTVGANRQGWTFFQRRPDPSYVPGDSGLGWNFRMYNGVGGATPLDTQTGVPYQVGQWQHVVVVYDPASATDASVIMYVNGLAVVTNHYAGSDPGYAPCTGDHDTVNEAVTGQPALSLGCYNNANTGLNPYFGAIDEFAWYSNKLSAAQILAHYQNATNANRSQSYDVLIRSDKPVVYLRLDEIAPNADVAVNLGDLRSSATGTNTSDVKHPALSALQGRTGDGAASYHQRNGSATTDIPWIDRNNPNAGVPFSFESWFRPTSDRQNPGAATVNNRYVGTGHRTGWVIFQRAPNDTYSSVSGYSGVGWNFRMYDGVTGSGQDVTTGVRYNMGEWQHFVVTWEPQVDNGDVGANGNDQWMGVLTAYFNGVAVVTNASALYAANTNPTEDASPAADLGIGSYNSASGIGNNPFEGDIDELALYNYIVLTPDQILAHYQAGTNSNSGTNYESLVLTAGLFTQTNPSSTPGRERAGLPVTYLRFNDPAYYPAANNGTVGFVADGSLVLTTNIAVGPQGPTYSGFEASNLALPLDGVKQWASFNNPSGLNISGQISLEAWVKPGAAQGTTARIISHGPQTISSYLGQGRDGAITNTSEVFLRIDGSGGNYSVGSAQYDDGTATTTTYQATVAVPAGDLGGSSWVYLVGTYDGVSWKLYRNGLLIATQPSATGALSVSDGDWAVGSTGNGWADAFAGEIDEVAIYNKAFSASQVAAHYVVGKAGAATLTIVPAAGGNVRITWPAGTTLQQSSTVNGAFTAVPGLPVSPLTIAASGTKFYRWSLP
jgi:hypothetical protein